VPNPPPPPHPKIIGAQRFFARCRTFDLECPHCGTVYLIRDRRLGRKAKTKPVYDRRTGIFDCSECDRSYTMGLLAWPRTPHTPRVPPADQVPGPRQLAQLRAEGGGWWMGDEYAHKGRPDPTNLTGEEDRPEAEDPTDLQLIDYDGEE
jgi:hypothetical protein